MYDFHFGSIFARPRVTQKNVLLNHNHDCTLTDGKRKRIKVYFTWQPTTIILVSQEVGSDKVVHGAGGAPMKALLDWSVLLRLCVWNHWGGRVVRDDDVVYEVMEERVGKGRGEETR